MRINIKDVFQYIEEQLAGGKKITVQELAEHFQVTRRWLYTLCRKEVSLTLQEYIKRKEVLYWKEYRILNYQEPLKKVIWDLGISRSTYYRRIYKSSMVESSSVPSDSIHPH